jgi:hypothetical protein
VWIPENSDVILLGELGQGRPHPGLPDPGALGDGLDPEPCHATVDAGGVGEGEQDVVGCRIGPNQPGRILVVVPHLGA